MLFFKKIKPDFASQSSKKVDGYWNFKALVAQIDYFQLKKEKYVYIKFLYSP